MSVCAVTMYSPEEMCFPPPGNHTFRRTYSISVAGLKSPWTVTVAETGYFVSLVYQLASSARCFLCEFLLENVGA